MARVNSMETSLRQKTKTAETTLCVGLTLLEVVTQLSLDRFQFWRASKTTYHMLHTNLTPMLSANK